MCSLNEEALAEALTQIVNFNIQHRIGTVHSSEEFSAKVCKLKCNNATSIKYFDQFTHIRQDDFITIKAYYKKIQEVSQKLSICNNWSQEIVQIKIDKVFCNGLNESVKLEMLKSERTSTEKIYRAISLVEDVLTQKL
ncbi:hypothetical protein DMUE_4169 [Dictyocoela muelleri]|nr:hypothetical protein DMUE_4169 [Dictyocoela muelleri]